MKQTIYCDPDGLIHVYRQEFPCEEPILRVEIGGWVVLEENEEHGPEGVADDLEELAREAAEAFRRVREIIREGTQSK